MKNPSWSWAPALIFALATAAPAQTAPVDGITFSRGYSPDKEAHFYRLGLRKEWDRRWFTEGAWFLTGHFELALMHLAGNSPFVDQNDAPEHLNAIAFTPVLRYQRRPWGNGIAPFVSLGIGASYFSEKKLEDDTPLGIDFSTHFQFEDKLSAGVRFGEDQAFEAALNFFHYSNGDLEKPNDGINIYSLSLSYGF